MNQLAHSKNATILPVLIALTLGCFALSPQARAVCQEGCLPNNNTALGEDALLNNTTGSANTAIGFNALVFNTTGSYNTANGDAALLNNTTGNFNTANGRDALSSNIAGSSNTAIGVEALLSNTTGLSNTAIGVDALLNNNGNSNIAVGNAAGANLFTGNNNIDIGNTGVTDESRTIRIGTRPVHRNTYIAGISGVTVANGVGVIIDTTGHLGTVVSSARFKDEIKPMDKASEAIFSLKPATFRYKKEFDPDGIPQFGLVAEEVEKVNPALVARDADGKAYTVRYEAVNAMLLNEFLKEHRKGQEQDATISQLKAELAQQQKEVKALSAQIQKVNARLATIQPVTRLVSNE